MKVFATILVSILAFSAAVQALVDTNGPRRTGPRAPEYIDNQYIVVLGGEISDAARAVHMNKVADLGVSLLHEYTIGKGFRGYAGNMNASTVDMIRNMDGVSFVEQDQIAYAATSYTSGSGSSCSLQTGATWGLVRTVERELNLNGLYNYPTDAGSAVNAYILDTGIYFDNVDFGGRASCGADYSPDGTCVDLNGHGTHVAGTVAGNLYGMCKDATIYAVKVLDADGSGSYSAVIAGVDFTASNTTKEGKPGVANLSLSGPYSAALNNAVDAAAAAGVAFAVAAGNEDTDSCDSSPASAGGVLTVASSTNMDDRSWFSNYGSCVDLFAPGSDITSDWLGQYGTNTISGTSMASPHVAGALCKYLTNNPTASAYAAYTAIENHATNNVISDTKGSPNALLYGDCDTSSYSS